MICTSNIQTFEEHQLHHKKNQNNMASHDSHPITVALVIEDTSMRNHRETDAETNGSRK